MISRFTIREFGARPHSTIHASNDPSALHYRRSRTYVRAIEEDGIKIHNHGPVRVLVQDGKPLTPEGAELLKPRTQ